MQFVGLVSRLWWDGVCDVCKFRSARTGIKEPLWRGAFAASQQNSANQCIDAASKRERERERERKRKRERERERERTGSEQLKRFKNCFDIETTRLY